MSPRERVLTSLKFEEPDRVPHELLACDEFDSPRQLSAVLGADELIPFQSGLPGADNPGERVDVTISYLANKHRTNGENALVLFLQILGGRYHSDDERHGQLLALAGQVQLEWFKERPAKPEAAVLEANPDATVQEGRRTVAVRARITEGAERDALYGRFEEYLSNYTAYREATSRVIPVVLLEPAPR